MKFFFIIVLSSSFLFAKTFTLNDIYLFTIKNSESYEIAKLKEEYTDENTDKSISNFYPKLDIEAEYKKINEFPVYSNGVEMERREYRRDITVNLEQVLYNRSLYLDYKIKKNEYEKSKLETFKEHQKIMYDVIKYYLEAIFKANQLRLNEQKLVRLNTILERAKFKYETGFISKADYFEAKAQRDELITEKTKLQSDYNITISYLERFSGLKNIDIKKNLDLEYFQLNNLEKYILEIENNLDVQLQQLKLKKTEIEEKQSFSKFEPTLSLNYEYVSNDVPEVDNDKSITLLFKVNIFNGLYDYKNYQQSKISKTIETLTFKKLIKEMKQVINNKVEKVGSYFKIIKAYPEILDSKYFSLQGMQERFNLGTKSIIDLLDEENKYFEKLNTYTEYKYQFLLEYTELHRYANMLDKNFLNQINGLINEQTRDY